MRRLFPAIICAAVALLPTMVKAAPITSIDGTIAQFTMTPRVPNVPFGAGNYIITFAGALTTQHNNVLLPSFIPTTFNSLVFMTPGTVGPGGTNYAFPFFGRKILAPLGADGGGFADFFFQSLLGNVPPLSPFPNVFIISGSEMLTINTTLYDYSPFSTGGFITFTLNTASQTDINAAIAAGQEIRGSGSFSQSIPLEIPEPASIAVWSLIGLGGLMLARRRLRGCERTSRRGAETAETIRN